uniref:Lipoprotein n=1 Tax=Chromera velia CCMP2878 TaxID=1169474 RepID=A0A0K6S804_9ALVE|eukprot:Cvel_22752.t1-p1 / transcript=Cvel_22752.t1 / gene=Cvel_22752 / organism=Chromera_velia_CCMP2878 / gene_product=hypothetical protein / transcript_product=hypothetical protein / location=Cvel_scaffold2270:21121-22781(+) / protein_length=180 / sequence_SO=supercontig / SO=protein_coding / is_pseudo=false
MRSKRRQKALSVLCIWVCFLVLGACASFYGDSSQGQTEPPSSSLFESAEEDPSDFLMGCPWWPEADDDASSDGSEQLGPPSLERQRRDLYASIPVLLRESVSEFLPAASFSATMRSDEVSIGQKRLFFEVAAAISLEDAEAVTRAFQDAASCGIRGDLRSLHLGADFKAPMVGLSVELTT